MVLRKGPNITHGHKNFRDVQGTVAGPDFLGELITQCQHQWGENIPACCRGPAYAGKRGQHNRCSTLNDDFRIYLCTWDGCHRSAVGNSSLILTSKFFFIYTQGFSNRHRQRVSCFRLTTASESCWEHWTCHFEKAQRLCRTDVDFKATPQFLSFLAVWPLANPAAFQVSVSSSSKWEKCTELLGCLSS